MTRKKKARRGGREVDLAALLLDPNNARVHDQRNQAMLDASLAAVGAARSIVLNGQGKILAGNGTVEAARRAGITKVRVVETDGRTLVAVRRRGLTPEQEQALALYDNRASDLGKWDPAVLGRLAAEGTKLDGFWSACELRALLGTEAPAEDGAEAEPPVARATSIEVGHVLRLGRHRLVCGDSTRGTVLAHLCGDVTPRLVHTDPPYGVAYANEGLHPDAGPIRGRVKNDDLQGADLERFLARVFANAKAVLAKDAAWYIWHAALVQAFYVAAALRSVDVLLSRQVIWVKDRLVFGRGQFHWLHEPCYFGWVQGAEPPDYGHASGERNQTTIWNVSSVSTVERRDLQHATPKPVGLFEIPLCKHLKPGEACLEPFAGSGPQFIAAEKLGMVCLGLELDPLFCQTIVGRWEKFTGGRAEKIGEVV